MLEEPPVLAVKKRVVCSYYWLFGLFLKYQKLSSTTISKLFALAYFLTAFLTPPQPQSSPHKIPLGFSFECHR